MGDCQDWAVCNAAIRTAQKLDIGVLTLIYTDVDQKIEVTAIYIAAVVLSIEQLCAL